MTATTISPGNESFKPPMAQVAELHKKNYVKALQSPHYLLGVLYDGTLGRAVLVFLSDDGTKLIKVPDLWGHRPYFLTDEDIEKLRETLGRDRAVDSIDEVYKINPLTMQRVKVVKVSTKDPLAVKKMRAKVKNAWEAKIKYHANYIFDLGLIPGMRYVISNENGSPKLVLVEPKVPEEVNRTIERMFGNEAEPVKKLAREFAIIFEEPPPKALRASIDVEVYTPFKGRVPNPKLAEYPIISIAIAGSDGFKKIFVSSRPFKNKFMYAVEDLYPVDAEIEIYDSERALILEFYRAISRYPVILSYNGDNFDLVYLYTRSFRLGLPRYLIPIRMRDGLPAFEASIHLDLYKFFSNRAIKNYAFGGKYQEDRLDAVSAALLGISKIGFEETVSDISAALLVAYNLRDAEITLKLTTFSDDLVWKLMVLMARISKTGIEEICRRQISSWIQNLFFWEHRRFGYLILNREDISKYVRSATKAVIEGKKYAGALVIEPPQGVFFNVVVLDIASLYPSVIKNYNLSYETVDMKWCSKKLDIMDEVGNKIHSVCMDLPGLSAAVTGVLRDFRVEVYKKRSKDKSLPEEQRTWYDVVQRAIKVFVNASYGVFGDEKFWLYSPAVAESVTALGRRSFASIILKAAEMGIKTLYGDTDSIFVWNPSPEQLELLQKWIQQTLGLDIDIDKEFSFTIFTGLKKNYLGRTKDGDIEIKGLVVKKRNAPELIKIIFSEIIDKLKEVNSPEEFIEFINWLEKIAKEYYNGLKQKEVSIDLLAIKTALTKDPHSYTKNKPPHVRAALQLRRYGIDVQEGDIITIVKVKGGDGYKAIQLARQYEIDPDKYIEVLRSGLEQFLLALGIKWEDIAGGNELGKLRTYRNQVEYS